MTLKNYIYWTDGALDTFVYGSKIAFSPYRVSFENPLLPPGETIKCWQSIVNFQAVRTTPTLPLLSKGHTYHLTLFGQMTPARSVAIKVSFFDYFGKSIDQVYIKDSAGTFTYPKEAYRYDIALISLGNQSLTFQALLLQEIASETEPKSAFEPSAGEHQADLTLIFAENPFEDADKIEHLLGQDAHNLVVVDDSEAFQSVYTDQAFSDLLCTSFQPSLSQRLSLVGYGNHGNFAALYYANLLSAKQVYISSELPRDLFFGEFKERTQLSSATLENLWEQQRKSNVTIYATKAPDADQLISDLYYPRRVLAQCPLFSLAKNRK